PGQSAQLVEQARAAKYIVIRGRTDASSDSDSETRLARRRAEAAFKYLVETVRLPPDGIRLSWQGAGDLIGGTPGDRQASRRVEIELYQAKPEYQWVTSSRGLPPQAAAASTL
ncbi:MAG: OmpA family protein, partial [Pseudomonadota bacterium]|nr:OmpA family protein [Pseudomonadota bacterium]